MVEQQGLVIRAQSRRFTVRTSSRELHALVPKGLRHRHPEFVDPVAVGDEVTVALSRTRGVIQAFRPRRNGIVRPASGRGGKRQLIAANVDLAGVVMAAAEPEFKTTTIDRYLVMASKSGISGFVILNKIDLNPSVTNEPELEAYRGLGIPVLFTSASSGAGIDEISGQLAGRTSVLLGPSGVGKTSLINGLIPGAELPVEPVSARTQKGRHATTWVEMLDLPQGGHLIDSPGLRVLDLSDVEPRDLAGHFPEVADLAPDCRFPDCRHRAEPDCAVKTAVEEGSVYEHRYRSYLRILESLESGQG